MHPTDDEILNALKDSGYLFEQEVGSILESNNYHIQTNAAFKDNEEEKSREIDVLGFRQFYSDKEKKIQVSVRVICECKNTQSPFVFITRNKSSIDKSYNPPNFLFPKDNFNVRIEGTNSYTVMPAFTFYKLNEVFPFHISEMKAVQFCKIIRKGKEWSAFHDGIYDSLLMPLIKCLEHYKKKDDQFRNGGWQYFAIYFPIVVLNSKIYSLDSHLNTNKLNAMEYLSFIRDIDSKSIAGRYLVDFVTKEGLEKYLKEHINTFIENLLLKLNLK